MSGDEVLECLEPLAESLKQVLKYGEAYKSTSILISNFDNEVQHLKEELVELDEKVRKKVEWEAFLKFMSLKREIEE